jgi:rubrerythrin
MDKSLFVGLIWGLIWGVVVGFLAKRKNRNPWGWGVAGALTWLIALLILAFMPYKCPKCGQSLSNKQSKNKKCPACGSFKTA